MAVDEESEYGGRAGIIQKAADGHVSLTAREQRFIRQVYMRRTAGIDDTIPLDDLHRPHVDEVLANLPTRTNGRTPDETIGEQLA